jgi:hypothetical protein
MTARMRNVNNHQSQKHYEDSNQLNISFKIAHSIQSKMKHALFPDRNITSSIQHQESPDLPVPIATGACPKTTLGICAKTPPRHIDGLYLQIHRPEQDPVPVPCIAVAPVALPLTHTSMKGNTLRSAVFLLQKLLLQNTVVIRVACLNKSA